MNACLEPPLFIVHCHHPGDPEGSVVPGEPVTERLRGHPQGARDIRGAGFQLFFFVDTTPIAVAVETFSVYSHRCGGCSSDSVC